MTSVSQTSLTPTLQDKVDGLRRHMGWVLALGILEVVAGIFAVSYAFSSTVVSVVTLGVLFLVAAGAQFAAAIMAPTWRGFFLFLLLGALYCSAGVYSVTYPMEAAAGVTVMLAFLFLAGGAFRIAISLVERFPSWGWTLADGILTVLLGVAVLSLWPVSSLWVPGTLVGIDLIASGIALSFFASRARTALAPVASAS
jgi:uncharacterized membrane protein HdeD (DUF308 family)